MKRRGGLLCAQEFEAHVVALGSRHVRHCVLSLTRRIGSRDSHRCKQLSLCSQGQPGVLLQLVFCVCLGLALCRRTFPECLEQLFKQEPMDAPGYADLAAKRRELLKNRLEARKDIGEDRLQGQEGLESSEELLQIVRAAEEQLAMAPMAKKTVLL